MIGDYEVIGHKIAELVGNVYENEIKVRDAEIERLRAALHHCVKALAEFEKDSNLPIEQFQYNVVFKLKGYLLGALDNAKQATGGE